ncbi:GMC oxidoreductase [Cristinia sonorae]|uniref:GMC oxidoreductase n=1 Tax=Cristinia sonorae TaxID=1940300 RepID=A0A8K0UFJ2_9AGAR|nr:GMC oxidoreductase [Cristinia sonorae]
MGGQVSKTYVSNPEAIGTKSSRDAGLGGASEWKEYDFIVVGGGTAGCVVASRLSEDPNVSVLLIEAGKSDGNVLTRMPLAFTKSYGSAVDWAYTSLPQERMGGKVVEWPRGKLLGGTSLLNASIYTRCTPEDFDQWVEAGGIGWSYNELEKYFLKIEKFMPDHQYLSKVDFESKGTSGPLRVSQTEDVSPIVAKIHETCRNLGLPFIEDCNANGGLLGFTHLTGTVDDKGERVSSASAYLTPAVRARSNLTIATNITVEKILFSETGPLRAVGVQVATSKTSPCYRIAARKEIIVSGGAFNTPQLLLVSGVGPKDELEKVNIKCVKDSPHVGKHLLDHTSSGPMIFRAKPGYTIDYLNAPLSALSAVLKWLIYGSGPMSKMSVNSVAFLRSDDPKFVDTGIGKVKDLASGPNSPDIEIMWAPAIVPSYTSAGRAGEHGITIAAIAMKAESEGSVTLKSSSIWDYPNLDGNFLESESDVNVILRGVRFVMRLVRTEPLKSALDLRPGNTDENDYFWFGDLDPDTTSDDDLRKILFRNGYPSCHPVGTCRMGGSPDTSVVGPTLKVHGIHGLRIVDASIFPKHMSAHPVAPIYAAAEKLSDMLKQDHGVA